MTGLNIPWAGYKKGWLVKDVVAGLTVAAVTIPVCMGYAQIAGLPPVYGLYAAIIPSVIYVLFASSRRVMFGTDAVIVTMIGGGIGILAADDPSKLPVLASMCALIIGVLFALFGLFKVGAVAKYLSKPTMAGFISGLAIVIFVTQIPKMLELNITAEGTLSQIYQIVLNLDQTNLYSAVASILVVILLILGKKMWPKIPVAIFLLAGATVITAIFGLTEKGVGIVGNVPAGVEGFSFPFTTWEDFRYLIVVCFATVVVVFADSILTARSFALRHNDDFKPNKELGALGLANITAGLFGAMPGSGSASRGAAAESAGLKTQTAQLFAAATIAVVLVFFNNLLYFMPTSVLAAIVLVAVAGLIDVRLLKKLFANRRQEFWVMLVTGLSVIILGVLPGVLISVAMSVFDFFIRASQPPQANLGKIPGRSGFYDLKNHSEAKPIPGVEIYRFGAPLIFSNFGQFESAVLALAANKHTKAVVISAEAITDIDSTAADGLRELVKRLKVPIYFAGLIDQSKQLLQTYKIEIPPDHIHKTIKRILQVIKDEGKT